MTKPRLDPFREARACDCGDHAFVGLTKGRVALLDRQDLHLAEGRNWSLLKSGRNLYAKARIDGREVLLHRLVTGEDAPCVDHWDRDGLNNKRVNLRKCSRAENMRNRRQSRHSRYPFKGIDFTKGAFWARITVNGKRRRIGGFHSAEDAARAYDAAALRDFGPFACTNVSLGLLPPLSEAA